MDFAKIIRVEIDKMERRITQRLANLIQQSQLTNPTASGNEDGVAGWPDSGGAYQPGASRYQHFGFRSVPPNNTAVVKLQVGGGSASAVTVAEDGTGYGPDPGPGGVAIYSTKNGAQIVIDQNGTVTVNAANGQQVVVNAGAAADVVVNGGTAKVALHGDSIAGHTHTFSGTIAVVGAGGTCSGTTASATDTISIPGARRFKGA